jgi:hypothetical protein
MDTPSAAATNAAPQPLPSLEAVLSGISNVARWKMLRELSLGEPREIIELAGVAGCSYEAALKHIKVLLDTGLIERGRGRLLQMKKHHIASSTERIVDFGHCLLRLDAAK